MNVPPTEQRRVARGPSDRVLRWLAWAVVLLLVSGAVVVVVLNAVQPRLPGAPTESVGDSVVFAVVISVFPLVGALILLQHARNTIGWVLMAIGLGWAVAAWPDNYAVYGLVVEPGSLPGAEVAAALNEALWAPPVGLMGTFLLLLFPNGHLPSRRWRVVCWLSAWAMATICVAIWLLPSELSGAPVAGLQNPMAWPAVEPLLQVAVAVALPLLGFCVLASAASLVLRFRRSRGVERLQLKWLTTAGAFVAVVFLAGMLATVGPQLAIDEMDDAPGWVVFLQNLSFPAFVLIPIAIGVAVLRYRLYDIDLVINRALVYGALSAMLAATYLGSVLLLQALLRPLTAESDLAVAGSTLAVAALFGPARRRIQRWVDRRFYRRRYDATRILDGFASRLRSEVDLDSVGAGLRNAVDQTLQPAHVSLWIRS